MHLFAKKNLSYLGVDLGSSAIKIVELKNEAGRPRLVTYGYTEMPFKTDNQVNNIKVDEMAGLINKICNQSQTTTKKAVGALPNFSVFSSIISLPEMSQKELDQAVVWEAKKFIPLPIEEMNLYWEIISRKNEKSVNQGASNNLNSGKIQKFDSEFEKEKIKMEVEKRASEMTEKSHFKILVTAASKKNVSRYIDIFQKANLDLITLETESFALERSLIGDEDLPVMIVDIGSISSDLTIVDKRIPVLNRSVDVGGATITEQISNSLHVDLKRAEQFKKDIGFNMMDYGAGKAIENVVEPIINEIRYCFDLYFSQEKNGRKIDKIILTGGSSFLPNLTNYLNKLLNIKVIIGDPWARVVYPIELKSVLDEIGPKFSVAIGLAMREIE